MAEDQEGMVGGGENHERGEGIDGGFVDQEAVHEPHNGNAEVEQPFQQRPRRFRFLNSENPFETFRDDEFYSTFAFSKARVSQLVELCRNSLVSRIARKTALTPEQKMLIFLDYIRSSTIQRSAGKELYAGVHQTTVCRIIKEVAMAINEYFHQFVVFPNENEKDAIAKQFLARDSIPGVYGCIDGSHIFVKRPPSGNVPAPERFYNRKSCYSINMVVVCDHTYKIRYFSARYPGSVHDARIFNESFLKQNMLQQFDPERPRFILGDEAFPCSNVLLTPINRARANIPAKQRYNRLIRKSRWKVESCFGVLKSRFRVLLSEQRTSLKVTRLVVKACVILHNFTVMYCNGGLDEIDLGLGEVQQEMLDEFDDVMQTPTPDEDGQNYVRQRILQNVYNEE